MRHRNDSGNCQLYSQIDQLSFWICTLTNKPVLHGLQHYFCVMIVGIIPLPVNFIMAEETVLQSVLIVFGNDNILKVRIKDGVTIDLKQAKIINENMRRHAVNGKIPILIDARVSYNWDKDAQQYLADHSDFRLATAVLSNNSFSRLLTNTYMKIFKPSYPIRIFTNEEKAIKWLKGLR